MRDELDEPKSQRERDLEKALDDLVSVIGFGAYTEGPKATVHFLTMPLSVERLKNARTLLGLRNPSGPRTFTEEQVRDIAEAFATFVSKDRHPMSDYTFELDSLIAGAVK